MKKSTALLLTLIMLFCLAACGAEPTATGAQPGPAPSAEEVPAEAPVSGVANPMAGIVSMEELSEQAKCALIRPVGAEIKDEAFSLIAGEPQIAEYDFTADGKSCTLRFADVGIETDISGIYHDGDTLYAGDTAEDSYHQTDEVIAHRWFTVDGQYVFIANCADEWEWEDYDAINSQFQTMEPKTWSSDVPFTDYLALTGTYVSEDGQSMASVSIRLDHALLCAYTYPDGENMYYWEMDAALQDGKLVYDKETISRRVVEESNGSYSADLVPEGEGGAGYAEVLADGSLSFAGAYSEALRGLVLFGME